MAWPNFASQTDPIRPRLHPALVVLARFSHPVHDHPACRLEKDELDLIDVASAANRDGARTGRRVGILTVPLCSVVIPTFNGRALLEVCLASVVNHSPHDLPIEVVVADDGSTDATEAWLGSRYPDVRVVRLEENKGFCAAGG